MLYLNIQDFLIVSRSTVSQIITYLDLIYANHDNNLPCLSFYFDIQKAFDSVSHHLLLKNSVPLALILISLICLHLIFMTSGVPQGSVLGPSFCYLLMIFLVKLFIVFIFYFAMT